MRPDIQLYNFKPGFRHELEILSLGSLYSGSRQVVNQPHRTDFYQIFWIQSGPHRHVVDFKPVDIPKNAILFVNKALVQSFDKAELAKGKLILFTDNFFSKTPDDPYHYDLLRNILHNFLLAAERQRRQSGFTELKKGADFDYLVLFKDLLARHFNHKL